MLISNVNSALSLLAAASTVGAYYQLSRGLRRLFRVFSSVVLRRQGSGVLGHVPLIGRRLAAAFTHSPPRTSGDLVSLDVILLNCSLLDGPELRQATLLLYYGLSKPGPLIFPAKRFGERLSSDDRARIQCSVETLPRRGSFSITESVIEGRRAQLQGKLYLLCNMTQHLPVRESHSCCSYVRLPSTFTYVELFCSRRSLIFMCLLCRSSYSLFVLSSSPHFFQ